MTAGHFVKASLAIAIFGYVSHEIIDSAYRGPRIGAVCRDGWHSNATGRGACSHHGGVAHWIHVEYDGPFKILRTPMLILGHAGAISTAVSALVAFVVHVKKNGSKTTVVSQNQTSQVTGAAPPNVDPKIGTCPRCSAPLVRRRRRRDGRPFIGCSGYPRCKYTRDGSA
jgi:hypothetical protein